MSYDLLRDAGIAAGVDEATIEVMREYLRSQDAYVTVDYMKRYRREAEAEKERAAATAEAMPDYHGAITRCQVGIARPGRLTEFDRCERKPKKVRRIRAERDRAGDGRLAVCMQHAKVVAEPDRWVKSDHFTHRGKPPTADEIVEPEYQP